MSEIKRAILLVGGYGSRLWPLTKVIPKSLLGVVDKPVIHYILEEIAASGIKEVVVVTGPDRSHALFEDYFDHEIKRLYNLTIILRTQPIPRGMVHALQCGILDNSPTEVLVGDDIFVSRVPALKELVLTYRKLQESLISLYRVPTKEAHRYGMVKTKEKNSIHTIIDLVEKPKTKKEIPSDFSIFGRYILTSPLIELIQEFPISHDKELFLPNVFRAFLKKGGILYGREIKGERFDAGSFLGLLEAQVYFGLKNKTISKEFKKYLKRFV